VDLPEDAKIAAQDLDSSKDSLKTKEETKKDEKKPKSVEKKPESDEKKSESDEKQEKKIEKLENEFEKEDQDDNQDLEEADDSKLAQEEVKPKEPTKEERAKVTAKMIQDNITNVTGALTDYIKNEASDICNKYIDEMPKAECIKKHKNLYSILIARQLRPDSVNEKQKKETVQSLLDSAW